MPLRRCEGSGDFTLCRVGPPFALFGRRLLASALLVGVGAMSLAGISFSQDVSTSHVQRTRVT